LFFDGQNDAPEKTIPLSQENAPFLRFATTHPKKKPMSFCVNRKMEDWSYQLLSGHRKKLDSNFHP